jgi:peptidyl-prolyl cis-trans isomerase SurA
MNYRSLIFALLVMVLPLSAQVASHASTAAVPQKSTNSQPVAKPVARVNGVVLTERDLQREMFTIFPYARQHGGRVPPELEQGIRKGALEMIIFEELVYQEAERRKMTIAPERLNQAEADLRKQFPTPKDFQDFLQSEFHGSKQAMRGQIRRSLLIEQLLKAEVDSKSTVTTAEAKAFYDKNANIFQYPESFTIQTISFVPPEHATPTQLKEARKKAEDALPKAKTAKNYEEFGVLAEKISEDDYHVMMGDHHAVERAKLAPSVLGALEKMQPGQVSDILQVDTIYTIVRLNQHVPAGKRKFEDVKESLKKQLEKSKTNQVRASLDKKLREKAKVEVL